MSKVSIAYFTKYVNNRTAMEYMKERLEAEGHEVAMLSVTDARPDSLPPADLYVFSSGIHASRPPGKYRKFLKKASLRGARYALVITHASPEDQGTFGPSKSARITGGILEAKGAEQVGLLTLRVKDMKGPLPDDYRERIDSFIEKVLPT